MKRKLNIVWFAALIAGLTLFASGCAEVATLSDWASQVPHGQDRVSDRATGHGWVPSENGGVRATFAFLLEYVEPDKGFIGALEFTDNLPWYEGKRVDLRGVIDRVTVDECRVVLYGSYEPQPEWLSRERGGEFIVTISCGEYLGLYGLLDPTFDISLDDGVFDGYGCGGVIEGGSIDLEPGEPGQTG